MCQGFLAWHNHRTGSGPGGFGQAVPRVQGQEMRENREKLLESTGYVSAKETLIWDIFQWAWFSEKMSNKNRNSMPRTPSQMDSKVEKVTSNLKYLRPHPCTDLDGSGEGDQLEDNNRDAEIVVVGLLLLLLCLLGEEPIIHWGELKGELDGV